MVKYLSFNNSSFALRYLKKKRPTPGLVWYCLVLDFERNLQFQFFFVFGLGPMLMRTEFLGFCKNLQF
jgi:hypothetical protein